MKSLLLSSIVIVGIVGGALLLKSNRTEPTSARPAQAQRQALPRFVDLGTTTCAPCRVMLGVMEELEQRYPGAMIVEFVNVNSQPEGRDGTEFRSSRRRSSTHRTAENCSATWACFAPKRSSRSGPNWASPWPRGSPSWIASSSGSLTG